MGLPRKRDFSTGFDVNLEAEIKGLLLEVNVSGWARISEEGFSYDYGSIRNAYHHLGYSCETTESEIKAWSPRNNKYIKVSQRLADAILDKYYDKIEKLIMEKE